MIIKGAMCPEEVKAKLQKRLILLEGYRPEKLEQAYDTFRRWLARVDELQRPHEVCIYDALNHFLCAHSPQEFAETLLKRGDAI